MIYAVGRDLTRMLLSVCVYWMCKLTNVWLCFTITTVLLLKCLQLVCSQGSRLPGKNVRRILDMKNSQDEDDLLGYLVVCPHIHYIF